MALEDFEKELEQDRRSKVDRVRNETHTRENRSKHHHRHHRHHSSSKHNINHDDTWRQPSQKRTRRTPCKNRLQSKRHNTGATTREDDHWQEEEVSPTTSRHKIAKSLPGNDFKRDSWMEAPSASDIAFSQRVLPNPQQPARRESSRTEFNLKIHDNELNKHHLQYLHDGIALSEEIIDETAEHKVDYVIGDSGTQWRMTKLKAVYRHAKETGQSVDDVAIDRYGDLRSFDDAREEQMELERKDIYGQGYISKEKPSGELYKERKLDIELRKGQNPSELLAKDNTLPQGKSMKETSPLAQTVPLGDRTALNKLKARTMKARLRGSSDAATLESEYRQALASSTGMKQPDVVVLGNMENRMLAGGRNGEVKAIDNKRGRERGLVEENEDMSVEDMVREERRTKGQANGESRRFAERIAKDGKFENDLDYMDESADKLAKRVQKSEINLKNTAISDYQKMSRILDTCALCHHEENGTPPVAPVISLATRVYLSLPTEPEISDGGACIVPVQHRLNLLECDDDEWEEIRNFMKCLTRMYHDQGRDVIFYENAAFPQRKKHAALEIIPLPYSLGETAPAFFKEAIMTSDEEWTQHQKIIDTLAKAKQGFGKSAFRRSLAKEMPYFHVWFEIDGGLGHIVEDANRWPKGDLFAREIIGGMLDIEPEIIKRQGRWHKRDRRAEGFRRRWTKFDWTKALTDN